MSLGDKIKKARNLRSLTQKELGFLVGLTDDRIGHYEINRRTPKESIIKKIADSTGFSMEYFKDHSIETCIDVMHTLFELKEKYGLTIQKSVDENGKHITEKGKQVYNVTIDNTELSTRVGEWLDNIEEILGSQPENSDGAVEDTEKEVQLWEGRYPLSLADKSQALLRKARKEEREKKHKD